MIVDDLLESIGMPGPTVAPRFHNERPPSVTVQSERPEHYAMVALFVRGLTQTEIAVEMNYSVGQVSQVLRQDWARNRIFELVSKNGGNTIQEMLRLEVIPSIRTLVDLRDDPDTSDRVRASVSMDLLDRYLGKATQRVETYDGGKAPGVEDVEALDRKIALEKAEIERLQGVEKSLGEAQQSCVGQVPQV